jgi:hypothetical protein
MISTKSADRVPVNNSIKCSVQSNFSSKYSKQTSNCYMSKLLKPEDTSNDAHPVIKLCFPSLSQECDLYAKDLVKE